MKRINYHFRRTPDYILKEVSKAKSKHVHVIAFIPTTKQAIADGQLSRFGIKLTDNMIICPETLTPDKLKGLYARRNRFGQEIPLKDLPQIPKTYYWDVPNFGDPEKGYHEVSRTMMVYQRLHIPAREWDISLNVENGENGITIVAKTFLPLDKESTTFQEDLFFAINLFQEQFRNCHVIDSSLSDDEIAKITKVGWEIFPPGTLDQIVNKILQRQNYHSEKKEKELQERASVLDSLHPKEYIYGIGMDSNYYGAKYDDNIVVFENLEYGNALYILLDNWKEISKKSRIDILRNHQKDFIRIIHKKGWEKEFYRTIKQLRKE